MTKSCYNCLEYAPSQEACNFGRAFKIHDSEEWARPILEFVKKNCPLHKFSPREQKHQDHLRRLDDATKMRVG